MIGGRLLLLVVLGLAMLMAGPQASAQTLEDTVKANYLVRFAAFVDWPPDAFASGQAPVWVCIAGRDPFGKSLSRAAAGQTAHGRPILVRSLHAEAVGTDCHILYLGDGAATPGLAGRSVLVISDERWSAQRAMVHFAVVGGRVRFHIDAASAARSGLTMNSRLLALALSVRAR